MTKRKIKRTKSTTKTKERVLTPGQILRNRQLTRQREQRIEDSLLLHQMMIEDEEHAGESGWTPNIGVDVATTRPGQRKLAEDLGWSLPRLLRAFAHRGVTL